MSFAQFIAQALITLASLGPVLVAVLVVLRPFVKNARLTKGLDIAETLVTAAVANAQQTVVNRLKDPAQPGEWTPAEASKVKDGVIEDVKVNAPELLEELRELGIAWPTALLGQLVEKSVLAQKAARPLVGTELLGTELVLPVATGRSTR